jgi:hypothetical protein
MSQCETHGWLYCRACGTKCEACEQAKYGRKRRCAICSRPMMACENDSHYWCPECNGIECPYCEPPPAEVCSVCDQKQDLCSFHNVLYCYGCDSRCELCAEEEQESGRVNHTCGQKMAWCAIHQGYICPHCDMDSPCALQCEVERHVRVDAAVMERLRKLREDHVLFAEYQSNRTKIVRYVQFLYSSWRRLSEQMIDTVGGRAIPDNEDMIDLFVRYENAIFRLKAFLDPNEKVGGETTSPSRPPTHHRVTLVERPWEPLVPKTAKVVVATQASSTAVNVELIEGVKVTEVAPIVPWLPPGGIPLSER